MAQATPTHVRVTPRIGRQILTDLSLLDETSYPEFIQKYPDFTRDFYIVNNEARGNSRFTPNKRYWSHTEAGKGVPSWKTTADVSALAGATATATVATGYYKTSGSSAIYSVPAPGHYFENGTNGQVYKVISKNEGTPGAHTVVLQSTDSAVAIAIDADDVLIFSPIVVGEASGSQESIFRVDDMEQNWCATIKSTKTFSDWALFEKLDAPDGYDYVKPRQMKDEYRLFLYMQERLLMLGKPFAGVTGVQNQHTGLVPLVKQHGQSYTSATAINDAYFMEMARLIDAEGYGKEYDGLLNIEYGFRLHTFLDTKFGATIQREEAVPGGALEINNSFESYRVHGIKWNFNFNYPLFSNAKLVGAPAQTGYFNNAALFIPRGESVDPADGTNVPRFLVRWQGQNAQDPMIRVRQTGGLAEPATNDVEELVISHVTHKGIQAFGLNGYIWTQPNFS